MLEDDDILVILHESYTPSSDHPVFNNFKNWIARSFFLIGHATGSFDACHRMSCGSATRASLEPPWPRRAPPRTPGLRPRPRENPDAVWYGPSTLPIL